MLAQLARAVGGVVIGLGLIEVIDWSVGKLGMGCQNRVLEEGLRAALKGDRIRCDPFAAMDHRDHRPCGTRAIGCTAVPESHVADDGTAAADRGPNGRDRRTS